MSVAGVSAADGADRPAGTEPVEPPPPGGPPAAALIAACRADLAQRPGCLVLLTGAGISTESGIPDFRGPQGVWTRDPSAAARATLQAYLRDPAVRRRAWQDRLAHPVWTARPNAVHRAVARAVRDGAVRGVITQNIDGLHQDAGCPPDRLLELHGSLRQVRCLACDALTPMPDELQRVRAGEADPPCRRCGGLLKSDTISFGQALRPEVLAAAARWAAAAGVFLAAGSSLGVQPAARLCAVAVGAGARLVVANAEPTPYDAMAVASGGGVLRGPLGSTLGAVLQ